MAAFQKLIAQYPQSRQLARAYYDLGITQQELELPAEAAKTFKAFLDKQEFTKHELANEVRLRWAMCLHDQGQADTAAAQFEQLANAKDIVDLSRPIHAITGKILRKSIDEEKA